MENLNAEQIKNVLEHCTNWTAETGCKGCPYEDNCIDEDVTRDALALITSQEQRIFELKNRLKECENGYEGTLFLDRCKLHDAEEKVEELAEENERLRAEKKTAIEDLEHCMYFAKPKRPNTCNFCTHDCEVSKDGTRCKGKEDWIYCSPVWRGFVKPKAEGE